MFNEKLLADDDSPRLPGTRREGVAWKKHLENWGSFAAASGVAFAMSTNATAGIIYSGPLTQTASLTNLGTIRTPGHLLPGTSSTSRWSTQKKAQSNQVGNLQHGIDHNPFLSHKMIRASVFDNSHGGVRGAAAVLADKNLNVSWLTQAAYSAKKLAFGDPVASGPGVHFAHRIGGLQYRVAMASKYVNTAMPASNGFHTWGAPGYVGFRTFAGDRGWVKVAVFDRNSDGYPDQVELLGFAYNTVADGAITAGEGIPASPTPEPGTASLGLLALGAAGVLALRKRRKEVAAN